MNILLIDDKIPDPHFGAGFPRAYRFLLCLIEMGHKIFFHPMLTKSLDDVDLEKLKKYNIFAIDDLKKISEKIDITVISRPHNMHYKLPLVKEYFPNSKVVYDTEALWYRRYDLQLEITGRLPSWAYRYDEIGLAKQVDLCYAINQEEKSILESHGVKNVMILAHALPIHSAGLSFEERKDILFVGGKLEEDSSNEDALWFFLDESWNNICEKLQANCNVTGCVSSERLKNHNFPNVNLMDHVNNLTPLYESNKIFVASTRFATGIPWKVHEAMANGIPCVISSLLGEQLGVTDKKEALVASTPEEFIQKTIDLYANKNLWIEIRENAFNLIRKDCDIENFKTKIESSFQELLS